jgi:methylenetetrahydrofolate dehydrogenase (NADP+)/methenyltetrahydrofolate cyclohydrolase
MTAQIIDGKCISNKLLKEIKQEIIKRESLGLRAPCLAVILIGNDPASSIYVNKKRDACQNIGIKSIAHNLSEDTTQDELIKLIRFLNKNKDVDGVLVQSPLPKHINESIIIEIIDPSKDVDGFHPVNIGLLAIKTPRLRSCTPFGVIKMLDAINIKLAGLDAVVVGASNNVGRPMTLELLLAGCTVTSCHSRTINLPQKVSHADLLVVSVGKPNMIKGDWIKKDCIVIDIGISRVGNKLIGDVEYEVAKNKASYITPVPGGVGPMTVATLMENTLTAQKYSE